MYIERDSFVTDDYFEVIDLLWFLFKNFPKIYLTLPKKFHTRLNTNTIQQTYNVCFCVRWVCDLAVQSAMLYACFVCGKNTLCKHLHIERYCLLLADRCRWCVYLSMKLIPINNKLKRCLSIFTMKTSHTHTHTHTPKHIHWIHMMMTAASDCEIKVLALVLTFVCASSQFAIIDNILRTKCLFLDHNLMSKDNHWKLYERFTVTDVLKSDWKSRLRHCLCTIKRRQIKKNQINAHIMNMNTILSPALGKSHSNEMKNWTRLQNHDESVLRFQQQSIC